MHLHTMPKNQCVFSSKKFVSFKNTIKLFNQRQWLKVLLLTMSIYTLPRLKKRTHFCEITAGYFMPQLQPLRFTVSLKIEELLAVQ